MEFLQQPTVQALAKGLLHFLWQGAILALLLHVAIRLWRPQAPVRYVLGVACLAAMLLAPVVTTAIVQSARVDAPASDLLARLPLTVPSVATAIASAPAGAGWTVRGVVVCLWLAGVALLSLRLLGGWLLTRRLVGRTQHLAAPEIVALARRVADRLTLTRIVGIVESPTIAVPMMIGWLAPVVILPTAALAGLTPLQIEALLAHELAHVRRHDYLVNLLQSVVETLLFYHPAVWWVSRDVRESREHCCDDLAVAVCDRVVYASALADLATLAATPRFALAATDGSLVSRVRRILGGGQDVRPARGLWLPAAVLIAAGLAVTPIVVASPARAPQTVRPTDAPVVAPAVEVPQQTVTAEPRLVLSVTPKLSDGAEAEALVAEAKALEGQRSVTEEQAQAIDKLIQQLKEEVARLQQNRDDIYLNKTEINAEKVRQIQERLLAEVKEIQRNGDEPRMKTLGSPEREAVEKARQQLTEQQIALDSLSASERGAVDKAKKQLIEQQELAQAVESEKMARDQQAIEKKQQALLGMRAQYQDELERMQQNGELPKQKFAVGKADMKPFPATQPDSMTSVLSDLVSRDDKAYVVVIASNSVGGVNDAQFDSIRIVRWEDGMTAAQAIERAGLSAGGHQISRLSMAGPKMSTEIRTEDLATSAVLASRDVIMVGPKKGDGQA
jgi:beta-lactamase regulating signal transducer with metallopeptidase domain